MSQALEVMKYKRSNAFIAGKYKASGLESQLFAIALTRLEELYDDKGLICYEAEIYPSEIRQLIKDDDHIYRELKKVANKMTGRKICIEDGKGNFGVFVMIPAAKYEDKVFKITVNKELKPHIYELQNNYTTYQLSIITQLKDWSIRIYEVLKKDFDYYYSQNHKNECDVEYRISEFRFMIGLANIQSEVIQDKIKTADWDELYDMLPKSEKKYTRPNDLQKNVLDVAKEDLDKNADITFDYELVQEGKFKKKIRFKIKRQVIPVSREILKKQRILSKGARQLIIPDDMPQYQYFYAKYEGDVDFKFGKDDLTLFLEDSKYNVELVTEAIEEARKKPSLNNHIGWIRQYIRTGGYENKPTLYGNVENAQIMDEFLESFQEEKKSGIVQKNVWASFRKREKFAEFENFLADNGFDEEAFIEVYGYDKACKMFMDWNRGREVKFE